MVEGQSTLNKRFGRILNTDNPETEPLDKDGQPTTVEIEYTNNASIPSRGRFPVNSIAALGPKTDSKLIVISGKDIGTVVKHRKTIKDNVSVKPITGGKPYTIPKNMVCPLE